MTSLWQITTGIGLLVVTSLFHVSAIVVGTSVLQNVAIRTRDRSKLRRDTIMLSLSFLGIVVAHMIEVMFWASWLYGLGALDEIYESIYFTLVTYTTLGYGDVVLEQPFSLLGAFAAVTGLLTFGLSTAFLVNLLSRILPDNFT